MAVGVGWVRKAWMKMVVFPPLTPPLKSSSLLLIGIGACSANSTSTPVVPLPMIAGLQAFSAEAVVVASILPCLQVGTPFALTPLFLSASRMNSLSAGGCLPSMVWIFPETLRLIKVSFIFDSTVDVMPPLKINFRLPTWTTVGFAATAMPPTTRATTAPKASVRTKRLRIAYLSPLRPGHHGPGHRQRLYLSLSGNLPTIA